MMQDLDKPLSNGELRELDDFLLDRVEEEAVRPGDDEGILGVSELDGLMTAMVSVPNTILPSRWWPLVWGDFEPVFDSTEQMERFFALAYRHMNGIAFLLMGSPDDFEPLFIERKVDGRTSTVVDEWCEGYMRGVALAVSLGAELDEEVETMLLPVMAFTEALDWPGHELPDREAIEELQQAITPCVQALHAYWLERRQEIPGGPVRSYRRGAAKVGRNDPCPCGSSKKYKKCCMR